VEKQHVGFERPARQRIRLVQHEETHVVRAQRTLLQELTQSSRRTDDDVRARR
jgi:hypothetical protein